MAVVLSTLRTELLSSVNASLYSASLAIGDYNTPVTVINTVGVSTIVLATVTAAQLQQGVIGTEYANLTAVQRDLWGAVLTAATGGVSISNAAIRAQIGQVWSAATSTRSALSNLQTRFASRAEVLFGEGTVVTTFEIYEAINP